MAAEAGPRTGRRTRIAVTAAAIAALAVVLVPAALGAFGLLRTFGATGSGPGRISPHAPAIAVAPGGRVYVADRMDGRVEAFTNAGAPDGGWPVDAPAGVAVASDDSVVVSGADGVERFSPDGERLGRLSPDGRLAGVAVGADGTVWAADPGRGRVVALDRGVVLDGLAAPVAVAQAPDGTLYVADPGAGRVAAFAPDGTRLRSWPAADPHGVAVTPGGEVLVADEAGNRVLVFDADGAPAGAFGDGAAPGRLNVPHDVATDCRGAAYVVDNSSLRVHVFGDAGDPPPCPAPAEPTPTPTPTPTPSPEPTPTATVEVAGTVVADEDPKIGVRGRATAVSGTVLVARKGGGFTRLDGSTLLPVGSAVDASGGHVKLEFEAAPEDRPTYGRFMSGEFYDGAFTISQRSTASLVDLTLLDEGAPSASKASVSARRKGLKVWGKAKGRFRTVGRNGAATVRGTQWLTEERPEGTYFEVAEGVVGVKDFRTGRTHILRPGDSYLARPTCVSRRAFRIRLRVPPGASVRSAVVRVAGKRVAIRMGRRVTAPIDLRGMPEGKVVVDLRVRTTDGRTATGRRVYRTCASKRAGGTPEL